MKTPIGSGLSSTRFVATSLLMALLFAAGTSHAQDTYPSRPIQLVTSNSAGMVTDIIARVLADKLTQHLGQSVVVQNKPGGGGTLASQLVASSAPDGYNLLIVNASHSVNPFLFQKLPYDTLRDFAGVALVADSPFVVMVTPQLGVRTLKEFIALAKQKPGSINYASAGVGSIAHLGGALFASVAGIEMVHVPYAQMSNLTSDFVGGRVQAGFFAPGALLPQIHEGKILALGVASAGPMREPLALPSVREATNLDYLIGIWYGIMAPGKTPVAILERLSRGFQQMSQDEAVKERFKTLGVTPRNVLLRDFDAYIKTEMDRLGPIVKASGATAN
ncbi:MAG: hypothetical protein EXR27_04165 [Betaproteobacteria bacterium]|nr:hypothetical protein [Betaproteobacteria bacterium]